MDQHCGEVQGRHVPNPDSQGVLVRFGCHEARIVRPLNLRNSCGWTPQANLFESRVNILLYVLVANCGHFVRSILCQIIFNARLRVIIILGLFLGFISSPCLIGCIVLVVLVLVV